MLKTNKNLSISITARLMVIFSLAVVFILGTPFLVFCGLQDSTEASKVQGRAKQPSNKEKNTSDKAVYEGQSVIQWAKELQVWMVEERLKAIEALEHLYPASQVAIPALREVLLDPNELVSRKAAGLLRRFPPEQVLTVAELAGVLTGEETVTGIETLAEKRRDYLLLPVAAYDNNPLYYITRFEAAMYLGRKKNSKVGLAIAALQQVKDDKDPAVRFHTAVALWRLLPDSPCPIALLEENLSEKDKEVCFWAAHALVEAVGPTTKEAISPLLEATYDPEALYHDFAMEMLLKFGSEIIPPYLEKLELPWDNSADAVADTLYMKLGEERGTEWLMGALKDKRAKVRRRALDILAVMSPRRETALPVFVELLADEDAEVRRKAVSGLSNLTLNPEEEVPLLTRALKDENSRVRSMATWALGGALYDGGKEALPALVDSLHDSDADVRVVAIWALKDSLPHQAEDVAPAIVKALKDKETRVRLEASKALVYSDVELGAVVPILVEILSDESKDVRRDAAHLLGRIGPAAKTAIPVLREALKDEDKKVRCSALVAVVDITNEPSVTLPIVIKALKDEDAWVRNGASLTLAGMGPKAKRAILALMEALHDESERVRGSAAYALGRINSGGGQSTEALVSALKDRDWVVRKLAVEALGKIGDQRVVEPLIIALKDTHPDVRYSASEALGKITDLRAAEPLLAAVLNDDDVRVRNCAASALKRILQANKPAMQPIHTRPNRLKDNNDRTGLE